MANWTTNILEPHGDAAELGRFQADITKLIGGRIKYDLNGLVPPGPEGPLAAWGATSGAFGVTIPQPLARPLEIVFESVNVPPNELIRRISILYPLLVFALRFVDECYSYVGWAVYTGGELYASSLNKDVSRSAGFDDESSYLMGMNPEAATIDDHEAVDWAERFWGARNAVPSVIPLGLGLTDRIDTFARFEEMASCGDLDLDKFCETASLLEAVYKCRQAAQHAITDRRAM